MNDIEKMRPERLAEEHWGYTCKMMKMAYVEAFIHGYKHGEDEERRRQKK